MKHKFFILIVILTFIAVTIAAYVTDTKVKKVNFINQNFTVKSENVSISNRDVELKLEKPKINNTDVKLDTTKVSANNTKIKTKSQKVETNQQKIEHQRKRYMYKKISWNEWQSNFINQILYDPRLMSVLNHYNYGAWFYYSFDVTNTGAINNVKIFSFYLNKNDKRELRNIIHTYAYKDATVFPANSKRKKAKVDAFIVLSNEFNSANPSDFNDSERIKIEY